MSQYVRRILRASLDEGVTATVPARPTGYTYIGWLAKGTGEARANGVRFVLSQGDVHFSGQLTTFDADYTVHGPAIHYLAELQGDAAFAILNRDIGALRNTIKTLDSTDGDEVHLEAFIASLESQMTQMSAVVPPEVTAAVRKIEAQSGDISIADLAIELGIGDRQFRRQFLRVVGMSPKSFAVCQRILKALKLLAIDPEKPIADVVYEAGFSDQSHLTKTFKQYIRTTPAKLELDSDGVLRSIVARV